MVTLLTIGINHECTNHERKKDRHTNTSNEKFWGWIRGWGWVNLKFLLLVFVLAILVTFPVCTLLVNTPPDHIIPYHRPSLRTSAPTNFEKSHNIFFHCFFSDVSVGVHQWQQQHERRFQQQKISETKVIVSLSVKFKPI